MSYHDDGDDVCGCGYWDCDCPGLDDEYEEMRADEAARAQWRESETEAQHAILAYGHLMLAELGRPNNIRKGDWRTVPLTHLVGRDGQGGELAHHVRKLQRAIVEEPERVAEYTADIGNIMLMIERAVARGERLPVVAPAAAAGDPLAELGAGPGRE